MRHLPPSLPTASLNTEQIETLRRWWSDYTEQIEDHLRAALAYAPAGGAPHSLKNLIRNACALAYLLQLHPSCIKSPQALAHTMGFERHAFAEHIRGIAEILNYNTPLPPPPANAPSVQQLRGAYPELDWDHKEGKKPLLIVPFGCHLTLEQQWRSAQSIAEFPGLTATLALTRSGQDALLIIFPGRLSRIAALRARQITRQ